MSQLDELLKLAERFKAPMATRAKMCSAVHLRLKNTLLPTSTAGPSWAGIPIYINEEIPPDRVVFYDQYDDVYSVIMLDAKSDRPPTGEYPTP